MEHSLPRKEVPSSSSSSYPSLPPSSSSSYSSPETSRLWVNILVWFRIPLILIYIYDLFPSRLWERAKNPEEQFEAQVIALAVLALQLLQFVLCPRRFQRMHWFLQCLAWVSYYMPMPLAVYAVGVMLRFQPPYWLVAIFFATGQTDSILVYSLYDDEKGVRPFAKIALSLVYLVWFCVALFEGAPSYRSTWHHAAKVMSIMLGFLVFYLHLTLQNTAVPSSVLCSIVAERTRSVSQDDFLVGVGSMESYRRAVSGCTTNRDIWNYFPLGFHMYTGISLSSAGSFLHLLQRYHRPDSSYVNPYFKRLLEEPLLPSRAYTTSTLGSLYIPYQFMEAFKLVDLQLSLMFDYFFSAHSSPSLTYHSHYLKYFLSKIFFIITITLVFYIDSGIHRQDYVTILSFCILMLLDINLLLRYLASKWFMLSYTCYLAKSPQLSLVDSILRRLNPPQTPSRKFNLGQHSLVDDLYHICRRQRLIGLLVEPGLKGRPAACADLSSDLIEHTYGALTGLVIGWTFDTQPDQVKIQPPPSGQEKIESSYSTSTELSLKKKLLLHEKLSWTCEEQTHTHTILIWHIATFYLESLLWSLAEETPSYRDFATKLSKYCYYLVAFLPELLPDQTLTTQMVLEELFNEVYALVVRERGNYFSKQDIIYTKLFDYLHQLPSENTPQTLLEKGRKLADNLYGICDIRDPWKIIADCWAELLMYSTPSENVRAHTEQLAKGGEFITHIWACLSNLGIVSVSRHSHMPHMAEAKSEEPAPKSKNR